MVMQLEEPLIIMPRVKRRGLKEEISFRVRVL
jgi:hypothetical protein